MKKIVFIILILNISFAKAQLTLTHGAVYNYDIGDVFITKQYQLGQFGILPVYSYYKTTVLNKTFSSTSDTVSYYCLYQTKWVHPPMQPPYNQDTTYFSQDTTLSYTDLNSPIQNYPFMATGGCYIDSIDSVYISEPQYCSRKIWHKEYTMGPTCFEPPDQNYNYVEGCGGPYYQYADVSIPGDDEYQLVYYKKGNDSCGTNIPYDITGVSILSNINNEINLYPNPATSALHIESTKWQVQSISIYNVLGERVLAPPLRGGREGLDVSTLCKGIYFVQITDEKGNVINKKVVVQ